MKKNKNMELLINNGIEESKEFLEMYKEQLKKYKSDLEFLEENKTFFFLKKKKVKREEQKNELIKRIKMCEDKIKDEERILSLMINNLRN